MWKDQFFYLSLDTNLANEAGSLIEAWILAIRSSSLKLKTWSLRLKSQYRVNKKCNGWFILLKIRRNFSATFRRLRLWFIQGHRVLLSLNWPMSNRVDLQSPRLRLYYLQEAVRKEIWLPEDILLNQRYVRSYS